MMCELSKISIPYPWRSYCYELKSPIQLQLRYQTCIIIYCKNIGKITMVEKTETNFLLISLNIVVLSHFLYPAPSWTLPIYVTLMEINITDDIKKKMQFVSLLSLAASFMVIPWVADFFSACALGLAMNVGYRINSTHAPYFINCCLAFGIILGSVTSAHLIKYETARDMAILVCTLPNLFMAQDTTQKKENSTLWFFSPFYDRSMTYAIGFIAGIFLPLSSINKHTRFLIISLVLLMTIFVEGSIYQDILSLLRGFFIYDQNRHRSEFFFIVGFIWIDIFIPEYKFNYLFVGYLVISVMLWHKDEVNSEMRQRKGLQRPLMTEMEQISNVAMPSQVD